MFAGLTGELHPTYHDIPRALETVRDRALTDGVDAMLVVTHQQGKVVVYGLGAPTDEKAFVKQLMLDAMDQLAAYYLYPVS